MNRTRDECNKNKGIPYCKKGAIYLKLYKQREKSNG